jgi:hypothetical protein
MNWFGKLIKRVALALCVVVSCLAVYRCHNEKGKVLTVLEWGRLAPFPKSACDVRIETLGSMFTRELIASFHASAAEIEAWLRASPGTAQAKAEVNTGPESQHVLDERAEFMRLYKESKPHPAEERISPDSVPPGYRRYQVKPGGGAQFAEVIVDELTSGVRIRVYWS